jgi:transcriptional regulator with XRE-family HTH domain
MKNDNLKDKEQKLSIAEVLAAIKSQEVAAAEATKFTADDSYVTNRLRAEFVAQLRAEMKKRGIKSDSALARLTGLTKQRIAAIMAEKGNIELRTIAKFAIALEAPVSLQFGQRYTVREKTRPAQATEMHLLTQLHSNDSFKVSEVWNTKFSTSTCNRDLKLERIEPRRNRTKAVEQGV